MMSPMKCVLAVAIIASVACSAYAIQCYQCESLTNPKCGKDFDAEGAMKYDCSRMSAPRYMLNAMRNATGCMKTTLENIAGHPQIVRTCYFGDISNTQAGCQTDPSLPFVKQLSCEVCADNLCNGSSMTAPIGGAILLFLVLARLMC